MSATPEFLFFLISAVLTSNPQHANLVSPANGKAHLNFNKRESSDKQTSWNLYFDTAHAKGLSKDAYEKHLNCIGECSDVEGFCNNWNSISNVDNIEVGSNVKLFKKGITPTWEHPKNKKGGKWGISIRNKKDAVTNFLKLAALLLCSKFIANDEICGITLSVKPWGNLVSIWIANSSKKLVFKTERAIKKCLKVHAKQMRFNSHARSVVTNKILKRTILNKPEVADVATTPAPPSPAVVPTKESIQEVAQQVTEQQKQKETEEEIQRKALEKLEKKKAKKLRQKIAKLEDKKAETSKESSEPITIEEYRHFSLPSVAVAVSTSILLLATASYAF